MPEEVGKLCEEGFQITAWKGIYMYIGIRQSYLMNQYHSKCTSNNTIICVLNIYSLYIGVICWQHHCRNAAVGIHTDCVTVNVITAIHRPVHTVTNLASRCKPCSCLVMQFMQTPSNLHKKGFFKTLEYPCSG